MIVLKPIARRIAYVSSFEILAILLSTLLLAALSGGATHESLPVAIVVSGIAVAWNYVFNTGFEAWERRRGSPARRVRVRIAHSLLFEAGLFLFTMPLYMIWYGVGPWAAFKMEFLILVFFMFYTFAFTWVFDSFVALPQQAG